MSLEQGFIVGIGVVLLFGAAFVLLHHFTSHHSLSPHKPIQVSPLPAATASAAPTTTPPTAVSNAHEAVAATLQAASTALQVASQSSDTSKPAHIQEAAKSLSNASTFAAAAAARASLHVHPKES